MTKAGLVGTKSNTRLEGFGTLEMLIAFVVVILSITAVIGVVFGSQSIGVDTQTNQEAQGLAQDILEDARAKSKSDFGAIINATTTATIDGLTYDQETKVTDISPCAKQVDSLVTWHNETRLQNVELVTALTSPREAAALGGDCASTPPSSNWENPQCLASDTFSPGKPTALDALRQKVYVGVDGSPFLAIADVESIPPDPCAGGGGNLFVEFTNGFDAGVKLNDVDVAKDEASGKTYAYIAVDQNTEQFQVIDVTNVAQPTTVAKLTLNNVDPGGSFPQGFRSYYYKERVYITARETLGREFHIIDVSDPEHPVEIGSSFELNTSVYDMAIVDQNIGGVAYRL